MAEFKEAKRELHGLTAGVEKRVLLWLAARTPAGIGPDHLTLLGLVAMAIAGAAYARSGVNAAWLHVVNACLFLNWLGDSLDGTLARFRNRLRPRYGFFVDHMVDAYGALFVLGGLGVSGLMSERIAAALLIAYLLLHVNIYLATYTLGTFKISFAVRRQGSGFSCSLEPARLRAPRVHLPCDLLLFDIADLLVPGLALSPSRASNRRLDARAAP
jgi:phosphatidylglycerophosphate synthase